MCVFLWYLFAYIFKSNSDVSVALISWFVFLQKQGRDWITFSRVIYRSKYVFLCVAMDRWWVFLHFSCVRVSASQTLTFVLLSSFRVSRKGRKGLKKQPTAWSTNSRMKVFVWNCFTCVWFMVLCFLFL